LSAISLSTAVASFVCMDSCTPANDIENVDQAILNRDTD
jgi:hypothetical protein